MTFEAWALERARRYLGVSGGGAQPEGVPAGGDDADAPAARKLALPVTDAEIDEASVAAVRDFPSSDAPGLLIVVIKELVASDSGDFLEATAKSEAAPVAAESAADAAGVSAAAGEEGLAVENETVAEPEGAAGTSEPAATETEAGEEVAPVSGPEDAEDEVGKGGAPDTQEQVAEADEDAANVLDETAVSEMREPSRTLPAHTEVSRLIAWQLPVGEVEADDWIAAVYFVKRVGIVDDAAPLDVQYHCGVLPMTSVLKLSQVISKAYLPAIHRASDESSGPLGQEVVSTLTKLSASLSSAVTSMKGNVSMDIPEIDFERGPALLKMDPHAMSVLKESLQAWTNTVRTMVEETKTRKPSSKSAMAEVEFWRSRYMSLDSVCERMHTSKQFGLARNAMKACLEEESTEFEHRFQELSKLHIEAKDNVKFLSTLERHLKMMGTAPLPDITESLPSLFNGLRMVWVLSRHYNTDERMSGLMQRIAEEISDRIVKEIDVPSLLSKNSPAQVASRLAVAKTLLLSWKSTYKKTREKIEKTGQEPEGESKDGLQDKSTRQVSDRWEFPEKVLFGRTDFIAGKLENLEHVAQTVCEQTEFFGPQLKKVIGDASAIDLMCERVSDMLTPFRNIAFDIFDNSSEQVNENKILWDGLIATFEAQVVAIDKATNVLIDASFAELRSTEGALQLLLHFKQIKSRQSISEVVSGKLGEILKQFTQEVAAVAKLWEKNKHAPIIPKNQPPVCGAIMWSRGLFFRIKKTILQFQSNGFLEDSEEGKLTIRKYIELGKALRNYENDQHAAWRDKSEQEAIELLKMPVLRIDPDGEVAVNFPAGLLELMREAKCLDKMGFSIGKTVLNIALREQQYIMLFNSLKHTIANYRRTLDELDPSLRELCSSKAASLKTSMSLGFTALNWVSLGSHDFIDKTNKEISTFVGFVRLIDKNASTIADIVKNIQSAKLVPSEAQLFGDEKEGLDLQHVFSRIENHRAEVVEGLLKQHEQINPLLCKIEEVAVDANTGRSPEMASYYRYFEKEVYKAIVMAVVAGMQDLSSLLGMVPRPDGAKVRPLIRISARATPTIVSSPTLAEVHKSVQKLLQGVVGGTSKSFVRWMAGTCIPCPPQQMPGQDETFIVSFYEDVEKHPQCVKMMMKILTSLPNTTARVEKSHMRFARFAKLWNDERQTFVERFVKSKARTPIEFDERLKRYANIVRDLCMYPNNHTVDFLRINYDQVLADITTEAVGWTNIYSKFLHEDATSKLNNVKEKITDIRQNLQETPSTMDEFKHLLQVIQNTREESLAIETIAMDVEERFSILRFYKIPVDDAELQSSRVLVSDWYKVVAEANERSYEVGKIKRQFAATTGIECEDFLKESEDFFNRISTEGPATVDLEMDAAFDLAASYSADLKALQTKKDGIVSAMKLFDLRYPIVVVLLILQPVSFALLSDVLTLVHAPAPFHSTSLLTPPRR